MTTLSLLAALLSSGAIPGPDTSPVPPRFEVLSHKRAFLVPFQLVAADEARIAILRLYASRDEGSTWRVVDEVKPEAGCFRVRVPADGLYWFAVQTITTSGDVHPEGVERFGAVLRVQVAPSPGPAARQGTLREVEPTEGDLRSEVEALRREVQHLRRRVTDLERDSPRS